MIKTFIAPINRPFLIAGPCSAETEEQVLTIAHDLASLGTISLFRAGIWKPRTRPNSFEGIGEIGLKWLQRVKAETGLATTTEVATAQHVEAALRHEIDVLWIGARTSVNPFSVQEIANALKGVDIPVMVKNPINPDLELWIGAIERLQKAGIQHLAAIHRGFSSYSKTRYRNVPLWEVPIELMRRLPEMPIFGDNSHICGNRHMLQEVAQQGLDLNFDGLMTEVHCTPDTAWSDAQQQITPLQYHALLQNLILRDANTSNRDFNKKINALRLQIDEIDAEVLHLLAKRMDMAEKIGGYKRASNISILKPERWNEVLNNALEKGTQKGLTEDFVRQFISAIHQESIYHQNKVMNEKI